MTASPASPAPVRLVTPLRSPSPCLNLDALSSDESTGPVYVSAVPISDNSSTPVNPNQVLSDDDLLTAVSMEDRRQVIRIHDVPPEVQVVGLSQNDQTGDIRLAVWRSEQLPKIPGTISQSPVRAVVLPPEVQTSQIPLGVGAANLTPVVLLMSHLWDVWRAFSLLCLLIQC